MIYMAKITAKKFEDNHDSKDLLIKVINRGIPPRDISLICAGRVFHYELKEQLNHRENYHLRSIYLY